MGLEGKALSLHRKKVLGETTCVGKMLSDIPSSRRYLPMPHHFFFGN